VFPHHRFSVASDGSVLQQAIVRAMELEEEDQYNRMGKILFHDHRDPKLYICKKKDLLCNRELYLKVKINTPLA
jgi:hypothetical protein